MTILTRTCRGVRAGQALFGRERFQSILTWYKGIYGDGIQCPFVWEHKNKN